MELRSGWLGRLAAAAAVAALSLAATAATAAAATAVTASPAGQLTLKALSFAQPTVDASAGGAAVTLNWRVTDSNKSATSISGDVFVQLAGQKPGTYVGQVFDIPYALAGSFGVTSSGTAQDSSYSYSFAVPQYASAVTARWIVTEVRAQDDQAAALDLSGAALSRFGRTLTATELADSTPPTYDSLAFAVPAAGSQAGQRPYVYDGGKAGSSAYTLNGDDAQSGFWKGQIVLRGPGGRTLHADFSYSFVPSEFAGMCGSGTAFDDTSAMCGVAVTIPAGTAAGTWTVSALTLYDNAGNSATYSNLNVLPIVVTADAVVTASGFTATPNPVDNWVQEQAVQISMTVSGARAGVSAIYVDFTPGSPCVQRVTAPVTNADGTLSVPVGMSAIATRCQVSGIAVLDGSGDLAVYGGEYGAPDPSITLTQVPDTTPPVATGASLSATSIPSSPNSSNLGLTVDVADAVAPVTEISTTVFDVNGNPVGGGFGGVPATLNGPIATIAPLPGGLAPGVYTVAFDLTDAGGLSSFYGYPNSQPVPGGPLTFTVTP